MGGYESYFQEAHHVRAGQNYAVSIRAFKPWARRVMTLRHFKQIWSPFHSEGSQLPNNADKCH
eukprot:1542977-Ditylum_brightwellii.AAC.1